MEELLIAKVKDHEVIYNVKMSEYREHQNRQRAWEQIAKELNTTAEIAKETWKKLRRCFCNARNRHRNENQKCLWRYEQDMEFLLPYMEHKKPYKKSNKPRSSKNFHQIYLSERSATEDSIKEEPELTFDKEYEESNQSHQGESASEETTGDDRKEGFREMKLCRKRKYEDEIFEGTPIKSTNPFEILDETDMFFLSMARMAKKLSKIDQARIKHSLSNSILTAEMKNHMGS